MIIIRWQGKIITSLTGKNCNAMAAIDNNTFNGNFYNAMAAEDFNTLRANSCNTIAAQDGNTITARWQHYSLQESTFNNTIIP